MTTTHTYESVAKILRDFGYRDVTAARVEKAYGRWQAAQDPTDIIDRFAFDMFKRIEDQETDYL